MEFSDLGARCSMKECNQQDYLPFKCNLCNKFYCLNHKSYDQHNCIEYNAKSNNRINEKNIIKKKINRCHVCNKKDLFELKCSKCNKYICLEHRYQENHDCFIHKKNINIEDKKITTKNHKPDSAFGKCIIC